MSIKKQLERVQSDIDQIRSKSNIQDQTEAMQSLLMEVNKFVSAIEEEKKVASQINELRRQIKSEPENKEEKEEYGMAKQALTEAEQIKRTLSDKKTMLRRILTEVKAIEAAIQRVLRY